MHRGLGGFLGSSGFGQHTVTLGNLLGWDFGWGLGGLYEDLLDFARYGIHASFT